MLPLTRPNRQTVVSAAFLTLTVAPTLYVIGTAWSISRSGHRRGVEAELGRKLGLPVTIAEVRYPRPGEVVYRGVVIRENESRGANADAVEVARADTLRLRRGDRELTIETEGLRFRSDTPGNAMARVGAMLERSGGVGGYERISLSAPTCDLDLGAGVAPYALREVVGQFVAEGQVPTVRASYRLVSGSTSGTRCELSLTRDRKADPVRTTLTFKTMEGLPIPARVLDPFFDSAGWLGPEAKVDGALTLRQDGSNPWEAEFQGNLLEIDLAELVNRRFPMHRLRGRARLAITSARWAERPRQGSGWVDVRGELTAGPGSVGFGLIQALRTEMNFRVAPPVARTVSTGRVDLDYRALALRFAMSGDGEIRIQGGLGNEFASDLVLNGTSFPIAYAPEGAANVRGLIKTLFPVTEISHVEMVPVTEKSRLLLCLPMPPDLKTKPMGGN